MADSVQHREFGVRFGEAIDNLKGKLPEASMRWDDLAGPVHGKVFTVAGAASADLAGEIQQALQDALTNGTTITEFRKQFDQVVAKHGWTYRGSRGWRTSIIFDTNMRSAHMAGRWKQVGASVDAGIPMFGEYRTAGDARVRPQHRAWNGQIHPYGRSFWLTHYPPNGWGCRCTVRWYTERQLKRKGLSESAAPDIKTRDVINRDGEITDRVPVGIDPGWDHNVGMSWISPELSLGHKLARLPKELRGTVTDKSMSPAFQEAIQGNWKAFQKGVKAGSNAATDAQVVGFLDSATMDALEAEVPGLKLKSSAIGAFDALPSSWSAPLVDALPTELRSYRAVLWDSQAETLVVVSQGEVSPGLLPTVVMRPNVKTQVGPALAVERLGGGVPSDLKSGRYRVLVGRID
jgi:SPP1 gp7 family putative phage head morphogenesis protein